MLTDDLSMLFSALKVQEAALQNTHEKIFSAFRGQIELSLYLLNLLIQSRNAHEQAEKIMRDSHLRFHMLAENATDIISRHAPNGTYLYASPACKTLLGYAVEDLLGNSAFKFLHHDDVIKLKKAFRRRKNPSNPQCTINYRIRRKEGEYRWFESNVRPIFDEKKRIQEIQMASRDITDRILDKKARLRGQQLARIFRLSTMEEMASGMAHEISQPLAAIVNYTQGCVRQLQNNQDPAVLIDVMKKAVAQAERAAEVLHRLKNFFCKGKLYKSTCKLNSLVRETVSLIRDDLNASKTKIDFELSNIIPLISADRIQLQQVFLNLIHNAIESLHDIEFKLRKIYIKTESVDRHTVAITFTDSGPGFSKDIINKVCKPFFTTKAHGSGMGLAICRSIIEAHGGEFVIFPNTHSSGWIRIILPIT